MTSMIVAHDRNGVIAVDGQIPWYIPEELSYFARTTSRKVIVMGRKTYHTLNGPLPNRLNVVLSKYSRFSSCPFYGCYVIDDPKEIINFSSPEHVFVIGGAEIYSLFAPYTQKLYVTVVNSKIDYKGDKVYFPWEDFKNKWKVTSQVVNKLYSTFVFERISSETKSDHEGST